MHQIAQLPQPELSILKQGTFDYGKVTSTGIIVSESITEEKWHEIIQKVCATYEFTGRTHAQAAMILGDLLRYGEEKFGEKFADAIDATRDYIRVETKTLANWQWIASKIDPTRRRELLSLAHHEAVAPLSDEDQEHYLAQAESDGLSASELKKLIREDHPPKRKTKKKAESADSNGHVPIENMTDAKLVATDLSNFLTEHEEKITDAWKPLIEHFYKLYRRRWMTGHKR